MSDRLPTLIKGALLDQAPTPTLCLRGADEIIWLNKAAGKLGLASGQSLSDVLPDIEGSVRDTIRYQPPSTVYRLSFSHQEKRCQIKWAQEDEYLLVWLMDVTEKLAIANRLRDAEQPANRKIRQLSQLATTASGYSELLDVVLEDEQLVTDKVHAVRQYQSEVSRNLAAMLELLRGDEPTVKKSGTIVVADAHQDLANLIAELLRAEGYRTECFTDANSVLRYLQVNTDQVSGAVLDEELNANDMPLIEAIKQLDVKIDVIPLSHCDDAETDGKITKPVDFEVLLRRLQTSRASRTSG